MRKGYVAEVMMQQNVRSGQVCSESVEGQQWSIFVCVYAICVVGVSWWM